MATKETIIIHLTFPFLSDDGLLSKISILRLILVILKNNIITRILIYSVILFALKCQRFHHHSSNTNGGPGGLEKAASHDPLRALDSWE